MHILSRLSGLLSHPFIRIVDWAQRDTVAEYEAFLAGAFPPGPVIRPRRPDARWLRVDQFRDVIEYIDEADPFYIHALQAFRVLCLAFRRDRFAVTAIEYGLIAALIAVVIIAALHSIGHGETNTFTAISGKL